LQNINTPIAEFTRTRPVRDDVEERIYGEDGEIHLASMFLCEECADLYFNLSELGYECISPEDNMRELVTEYAETHMRKIK
jgi:hypothetical protein